MKQTNSSKNYQKSPKINRMVLYLSKKNEFIFKEFPTKKTRGPNSSTKHLRKKYTSLHHLFQKIKEKTLPL